MTYFHQNSLIPQFGGEIAGLVTPEARLLPKLSRSQFLDYFTTKQEYDTEMKEWLTYNDEL
jgi:hypothetical protein